MAADLKQLPVFVAIDEDELRALKGMMERIEKGEVTSLLCCYYDKTDDMYRYITGCSAYDRIVMASLIQHRTLKSHIENGRPE